MMTGKSFPRGKYQDIDEYVALFYNAFSFHNKTAFNHASDFDVEMVYSGYIRIADCT